MKKPMVRKWNWVLAILGSVFWLQTVFAAEAVTVTGFGADREEALRDAMRLAVERAVGTAIVSETLVQNAAIVQDEIYTKAQGVVQSYTILSEGQMGEQYKVTAAVTVDSTPGSPLMRKLERILLAKDPRIAVVVLNGDLGTVDAASEGAIIEGLTEYGFTRVLDAEVIANRYGAQYLVNLVSNMHGLSDLPKGLGLDYLIVGRSRSEASGDLLQGFGDGSQLSGMYSYKAHIDARLLKADTGEIVAAHGENAAAVDIAASTGNGKALAAAGKALGVYMAEQLGTQATKTQKNVQIVASLQAYEQVNILQRALRQIAGVSNVYVRSYQSGTATIDVDYGNTAQALVRGLNTGALVQFEIEEIAQSLICLRVI